MFCICQHYYYRTHKILHSQYQVSTTCHPHPHTNTQHAHAHAHTASIDSLGSLEDRLAVCLGVQEEDTDRGRINQLQCSIGRVTRDHDSLYQSLSLLTDGVTTPYEIRMIIATHVILPRPVRQAKWCAARGLYTSHREWFVG